MDTKSQKSFGGSTSMPLEAAHQQNIPSIDLPKGGGAIKGIEEKFQMNPVTGSLTLTIPIPTSPSRNGFSPTLAVSYDSGNGNSIFGLGWQMPLPSITRKTDNVIPQYNDGVDS